MTKHGKEQLGLPFSHLLSDGVPFKRLSFLVSCVFPDDGQRLCSKVRKNDKPYSGYYWSSMPKNDTLSYTNSDILDLVECVAERVKIWTFHHSEVI